MKFFIVEPSPLLILITLGPKYSPQDPVNNNNNNNNNINNNNNNINNA